MNIVGRLAPLTFAASLFLGAVAVSVLLHMQSYWKVKEQVELSGKQLATALEISIADRLRAIQSLAKEFSNSSNYNIVSLNNKSSSLVKGMPGLVRITIYDKIGNVISSNTAASEYLATSKKSEKIHAIVNKANGYTTNMYFGNGVPFLEFTFPLSMPERDVGSISGVINVESMILAYTSDFEMSSMSFLISEDDLFIYSRGAIDPDIFYSKSDALVAGRHWGILLQSNSSVVLPSFFILLIGAFFALAAYFFLKKIRDREQKQSELANIYKNAADASLDALFTFEALEVHQEIIFVLQSANEIAKSHMSGWPLTPGTSTIEIIAEFASCPRIIEMAKHVYLNDESQSDLFAVVIEGKCNAWFRIQIAKSHIGIVVTLHDVSKEQELSQVILHQAQRDSLTGALNRQSLTEIIEELLSERHSAFLCFLDLDRFKPINDNCGHVAGDELLRSITHLFQSSLRRSDLLARVGGDEFCVLIKTGSIVQLKNIMQRIINEVSDFKFYWGEQEFTIGVSIGVVDLANNSGLSCVDFMKIADAGCYIVKRSGGNGYFIVDKDSEKMKEIENERRTIQGIIDALSHDKFELYSQKIMPIAGMEKYQLEILLRLRSGDGSYISPAFFIPLAERSGLMQDIDKWVVSNVIRKLSENQEYTSKIDKCAINISAVSLSDPSFLKWLVENISAIRFPSSKLCFEITETAAITNLQQAQLVIKELSALGCKFSLDDFGVGMSSFGALRSLDVEYVKIDGLFIKNISKNDSDINLVRSMVEIVHSMNKLVVAEFVSDQSTVDILRKLGVEYGQGYGLSVPEPWLLRA